MKRWVVLAVLAGAIVLGSGSAMADAVIYSDNFAGPTLNPAWQVLAGQGAYAMVGDLRYYNQGPLSNGYIWSTTSLSLALPFTGTNWELDAEATYNLAWLNSGNYTGPPDPNYSNSAGGQIPQIIVSFDPVTAANRTALSGGQNSAFFNRGTDAWYGANNLTASYDNTSVSLLLNPADTGIVNNFADGTYWYRFVRDGGALTMTYSYDGVHYLDALSAQLPDPSSSFNELVLSGTTWATAGSYTDYRIVTITAPDSAVPEPSSIILLATMLGAAGLGLRKRMAGAGR